MGFRDEDIEESLSKAKSGSILSVGSFWAVALEYLLGEGPASVREQTSRPDQGACGGFTTDAGPCLADHAFN